MSTKRKRHIRYLTFTLVAAFLIAMAVLVPAMSLGQPAEAQTSQESPPPPGAVTDMPTEVIDVDLVFDYKIPSKAEIAETKKEAMQSSEYKAIEKQQGKDKAEKELDKQLKEDLDYLKEMNQKGKEKIQLAHLGEGSPYYTQWTYAKDWYGNCTATIEDPMNLFFYNRGADTDVAVHLSYRGWGVTDVGGNACAWTGTYNPGTLYTSDLRQQHFQMALGAWWGERDHVRIWWAPYDPSWAGYWSVASTHYEKFNGYTHCVLNYDNSEGYLVERMGFPTSYWDSPNGPFYLGPKCDQYIYNDGWTPMVNVWWTY